MEEGRLIFEFMNDAWKIIKASLNTHTDDEWEWVVEETKKLNNNPKYKTLRPMSTEWLASYIAWLEERNHEAQK